MGKQIVVRLSEEDHLKFKLKVIQEKTSIQELLENFIKDYIKDSKDE